MLGLLFPISVFLKQSLSFNLIVHNLAIFLQNISLFLLLTSVIAACFTACTEHDLTLGYLYQGFVLLLNVFKQRFESTIIYAIFSDGEAVPNFLQSSLLTKVQ